MEDERILSLLTARDERAVSEAGDQYGTLCRNVILRIVKDPEEARECLNDLWLRLWNAEPPPSPGTLPAFLSKTARNLALDRVRFQNRRKRGGDAPPLTLDALTFDPPAADTASGALEQKELARCIDTFLRTLPQEERRVFLRRYYYFDEISQIAERDGLKRQRVKHILFKTRRALKEYLILEGYDL